MRHPLLYEINARAWATRLSLLLGRRITLAEVPDDELDRLAAIKLDFVWLMGVWPSGPTGIAIARSHEELRREYRRALPDFTPEDVGGSPYSIAAYVVDERLGGAAALAGLRERLADRGIGLILDFVVNHTGVDHPWAREQPKLYVQGDLGELAASPAAFFALDTALGPKVLAHGRDPYFPPWTDTAQLNLTWPDTRSRLSETLLGIAAQCDGVRCDMAMLALEPVFRQTWGERRLHGLESPPADGELWHELISRVRVRHPGFLLIAESYWGTEGMLRALGFDYTYDRILYERLAGGTAREILDHLQADSDLQQGCVRFLENHDEQRAAFVFPWERHRAAAVIAATLPGMALFQEGQLTGRRVKLPIQLRRDSEEPAAPAVWQFYERLFRALEDPTLGRGRWHLLQVAPAWDGNPTWQNFVAYEWVGEGGECRLVVVNFAGTQGQCYLRPGHEEYVGRQIELRDRLGEARYLRDGSELVETGLYLDLPAFGFHAFEVQAWWGCAASAHGRTGEVG